MQIAVITHHAEAARILQDAGVPVPRILAGCNTISQHLSPQLAA